MRILAAFGLSCLFSFLLAPTAEAQTVTPWTVVANFQSSVGLGSVDPRCDYRLKLHHSSDFYGTIDKYYRVSSHERHEYPLTSKLNPTVKLVFKTDDSGEALLSTINPTPPNTNPAANELFVSFENGKVPALFGHFVYFSNTNTPFYAQLNPQSKLSTFTVERRCN